ncbi:segregation/condensation protein A [Berryella wangjianweii]|uniref:Segregation and condensation protein A n=1 Tax=Berryella wangjianweii TaxID=2734634 RepID=A0A6M8IZL0_9ACTN|nr:segregation/condensation protein A [Berryella wangjianweii]NPD32469.1 segregation/condensation protein A [Eggerthellaceae bacterium zg-997]QKF06774.1 segregation/condensation protein A [Berryella wangjianweii]
MAYRVRTDTFEGPFDLLLYLVSRQKVDIGSISIAQIADQYLAEVDRMRSLDLEVASDFLLVASTLLEMKAHSLLPREREEGDEEFEELPAAEARNLLVGKLLTYKHFKNAAGGLAARYELRGRMMARTYGPDADLRAVMPDFLRDVSLDGLAWLAASAYMRREAFLLESEHIASKPLPVEVQARVVRERIAARGTMRFSELLHAGAPAALVVVTFLAVLELFKRAEVNLRQDQPFGDVVISMRVGAVLAGGDAGNAGDDATGERDAAAVREGRRAAWGDVDARDMRGPAPIADDAAERAEEDELDVR